MKSTKFQKKKYTKLFTVVISGMMDINLNCLMPGLKVFTSFS